MIKHALCVLFLFAAASIAAAGRFRSRKPPELKCVEGTEIVTALVQLLPPSFVAV